MKKFLTIILILFLVSCGTDDPPETPAAPPVVVQPPVNPPDDPPVANTTKILAINVSGTLKFWDGLEFTDWQTGNIKPVAPGVFAVDSTVYTLDEFGETTQSSFLPVVPDFIAVSGADTYIVKKILPADALSAGGMYKHYSEIWKNGATVNHWSANQFETVVIIKTASDVVAETSTGAFYPLTGSHTAIHSAWPGGVLVTDYDSIAKTATFRHNAPHLESWGTNNMSNAKRWQESGGVWYSNNGYTWDAMDGLQENATVMTEWQAWPYPVSLSNGEPPTLLPAGTNLENSETVIYWLECNTGLLIRQIVSVDQLQTVTRLYPGDGTRVSGNLMSKAVRPVLIDGHIYFNHGGNTNRVDLTTGNTSVFYAANAEIYKMR
jgi:hypothetical protein